jgi:uncharacterized protein (TIGR03067 family)
VIALEIDGRKEDLPKDRDPRLKFGPEKIEPLGTPEVMVYKLGVDGKVRTIDLTADAGPMKGKTLKGVYQLEGDSLKICIGVDPNAPRPTDLTSAERRRLLTFKREK